MSESIAKRVGRLVTGSLNALIESAENASPQIVMKECIREVDQAIQEIRQELGKSVINQKHLEQRIGEEQLKHDELQNQIQIALQEGREDLAEVAISKQMDIEAQIPVMKQSLQNLQVEANEYEGYIIALQAKKREMENDYKQFQNQQAEINEASQETAQDKVSKAEEAFSRVMGINTAAPQHTDEAKLQELEELTRKNRIKERLSALKATQ